MAFTNKKTLFILLIGFLLTHEAISQKVGVKINTGFSRMGSSALKKSMESMFLEDPYLIESGSNSGIGSNIGIGGYIEYKFNEKIYALSDPAINFSRSNIFMTTVRNHYENEEGFSHRISSQAQFRMAYINLPLLAKYIFHYNKGFYALGGLGVNFFLSRKIHSTEENIYTPLSYDAVGSPEVEKLKSKAKINGFSPVRLDFILGVGKAARFLGRDMFIDLRYSLPISRTPLYTSDPEFTDRTLNNYVFSQEGKELTEDFTYRNIKNFNFSTLIFTVRYSLYDL